MNWIPFPDPRVQICGLPWFAENSPEVWRLPKRLRGVVREPVWNLAESPSGGRRRFSTDAAALGIRLRYATFGHMNNMCTVGQMGVDLYVGQRYWRTAFPTQAGDLETTYFAGLERTRRDVTLYLPLYHPVQVVAVGVEEGAELHAPPPFSNPRPVVYYGTSITQGGCSSRGGLSYQAILSRELDLDFVNLGFSGNGKGDPELAEVMTEIDAACYVLDFAQNNGTEESLRAVYAPFLAVLRTRRPHTPVVCITPIFTSAELQVPPPHSNSERLRQVIRDAVTERRHNHDGGITLVEGRDLLGPKHHEGLVDGVHPNDLGFQAMADNLAPVLRRVLRHSHPDEARQA